MAAEFGNGKALLELARISADKFKPKTAEYYFNILKTNASVSIEDQQHVATIYKLGLYGVFKPDDKLQEMAPQRVK